MGEGIGIRNIYFTMLKGENKSKTIRWTHSEAKLLKETKIKFQMFLSDEYAVPKAVPICVV